MSTEVITLCGSTKFKKEFLSVLQRFTLEGKIVLTVGAFGHADNIRITDEQKQMLDALHLKKIDMSDSIYVIDVGGYIGESTSREIAYAKSKGIPIRYLSKDERT